MDIYFFETFEDEAKLLGEMLGNQYTFECSSGTIQEIGHTEPPARLISIRTQSNIPVDWADKIDGVLSRTTGYDHLIAYRASIKRTLPLGFLEEYATRAVAEHAILLVMALLRRLPRQLSQFPSFNREGLTGVECEGKNLLVVGVGRIGSEIVMLARSLGFVVRGVDIKPDKSDVTYVSKQEGVPWADVIVCAMNLTAENKGYFSHKLMRRAQKGCHLVNIARGEHTPLADMECLLHDGHLAGLGLDVFEDEGDLAVSLRSRGIESSPHGAILRRILTYPNVVLTPHNAFNSSEALRRKSAMTVEQIQHFFKHRDFKWKVE